MSFGKHAWHSVSAVKGITMILLKHRIDVRDMLFSLPIGNAKIIFSPAFLHCTFVFHYVPRMPSLVEKKIQTLPSNQYTYN